MSSLEDKQDKAYNFGAKLGQKHREANIVGAPPLDKVLELVGGKDLSEQEAETIFEFYEDGYYEQKFKEVHNGRKD